MAKETERARPAAKRHHGWQAARVLIWGVPAVAAVSCLWPEPACEDATATCMFISDCGPGHGHLSPGQCPGVAGAVCCVPEETCASEDFTCCLGSHAARPACVDGALRCPRGATLAASGSCLDGSGCELSGGRVITGLCCGSTADFPNTCAIGACGCGPDNSHEVAICECPAGQCFDGSRCVGL